MGKKRKTRKEKIILQLKRELARERQKTASSSTKIVTRQGAISIRPKTRPLKQAREKKTAISIPSYDLRLIRKDLLKTLILALTALSLEVVLYLKLR